MVTELPAKMAMLLYVTCPLSPTTQSLPVSPSLSQSPTHIIILVLSVHFDRCSVLLYMVTELPAKMAMLLYVLLDPVVVTELPAKMAMLLYVLLDQLW